MSVGCPHKHTTHTQVHTGIFTVTHIHSHTHILIYLPTFIHSPPTFTPSHNYTHTSSYIVIPVYTLFSHTPLLSSSLPPPLSLRPLSCLPSDTHLPIFLLLLVLHSSLRKVMKGSGPHLHLLSAPSTPWHPWASRRIPPWPVRGHRYTPASLPLDQPCRQVYFLYCPAAAKDE